MKLLVVLLFTLSVLGSNILLSTLFSDTINLCSLEWKTKFHTHTKAGNIQNHTRRPPGPNSVPGTVFMSIMKSQRLGLSGIATTVAICDTVAQEYWPSTVAYWTTEWYMKSLLTCTYIVLLYKWKLYRKSSSTKETRYLNFYFDWCYPSGISFIAKVKIYLYFRSSSPLDLKVSRGFKVVYIASRKFFKSYQRRLVPLLLYSLREEITLGYFYLSWVQKRLVWRNISCQSWQLEINTDVVSLLHTLAASVYKNFSLPHQLHLHTLLKKVLVIYCKLFLYQWVCPLGINIKPLELVAKSYSASS
jgi:hypothetical protein